MRCVEELTRWQSNLIQKKKYVCCERMWVTVAEAPLPFLVLWKTGSRGWINKFLWWFSDWSIRVGFNFFRFRGLDHPKNNNSVTIYWGCVTLRKDGTCEYCDKQYKIWKFIKLYLYITLCTFRYFGHFNILCSLSFTHRRSSQPYEFWMVAFILANYPLKAIVHPKEAILSTFIGGKFWREYCDIQHMIQS